MNCPLRSADSSKEVMITWCLPQKKETRLQLCHFKMEENTKFRLYFLSFLFFVVLGRRSVRGNRVDKVGVGGAPDKCGGLYLS